VFAFACPLLVRLCGSQLEGTTTLCAWSERLSERAENAYRVSSSSVVIECVSHRKSSAEEVSAVYVQGAAT